MNHREKSLTSPIRSCEQGHWRAAGFDFFSYLIGERMGCFGIESALFCGVVEGSRNEMINEIVGGYEHARHSTHAV